MEKSSSLVNIAKALGVFHGKIGKIKKDANNPFFKSKYATLSNILDCIQEPLIESGLVFSQMPTQGNTLTTILVHSDSGEYLQGSYDMTPTKQDPQAIGSAITYARRYALGAILGLNIDDDDDGNAASQPQQKQVQQNDDKPWLNKADKAGNLTDEWIKVTTALQDKKATLAQVESKYKLSKLIKEELSKI